MLLLPQVSLVVVETRMHKLAALAIRDILEQIQFGEILIFSNQFNELRFPNARHILIADWPTKLANMQFIWNVVPHELTKTHMLYLEWDAGVYSSTAWDDKFLDYDYVGAPWNYHELNVGNGGFSLRSTKLAKFLAHNEQFPPATETIDDLLCRQYQPYLPQFLWAPDELAQSFALERKRNSIDSLHFGYHGVFNWPFTLPIEKFRERMSIAKQENYITETGMWAELQAIKQHRWYDGN